MSNNLHNIRCQANKTLQRLNLSLDSVVPRDWHPSGSQSIQNSFHLLLEQSREKNIFIPTGYTTSIDLKLQSKPAKSLVYLTIHRIQQNKIRWKPSHPHYWSGEKNSLIIRGNLTHNLVKTHPNKTSSTVQWRFTLMKAHPSKPCPQLG